MKISAVMCTHKRPLVTFECLRRLARQTVPLDIVLVGDNPADRKVARASGCMYTEYSNEVLGAKWLHGVQLARSVFDSDAILIIGSDDWLTDNWVEVCAEKIRAGFDLVGKNRRYQLRVEKNAPLELIECRYQDGRRNNEPIGAGRMFSRWILDAVHGSLFSSKRELSLDGDAYRRVLEAGAKVALLDDEPIEILLLKGAWHSMHPWKPDNKNFVRHVKSPISWLTQFFPGFEDAIERLRSGEYQNAAG